MLFGKWRGFAPPHFFTYIFFTYKPFFFCPCFLIFVVEWEVFVCMWEKFGIFAGDSAYCY